MDRERFVEVPEFMVRSTLMRLLDPELAEHYQISKIFLSATTDEPYGKWLVKLERTFDSLRDERMENERKAVEN